MRTRVALLLVLTLCLDMQASQEVEIHQVSQSQRFAIHEQNIENHPNIQRLKQNLAELKSAHRENIDRLKQMYDIENGLRAKKKFCFTCCTRNQDMAKMFEIQEKIDTTTQEYQKNCISLQDRANAEHLKIAAQDEYKELRLMTALGIK